MHDLFFGQRRFYRHSEHGQNFSAASAVREVVFAPRNFVRLERFFVVRRDQLGVGTPVGVVVRELVEGFAHPPSERFFSTAIA
jgi:hypothetical protein